jgi:hypothetical protein
MEFPSTIKKIHIMNLSHATPELGWALKHILDRLSIPVEWKDRRPELLEKGRDDILYIFICVPPFDILGVKYYIFWQLEYLQTKSDSYYTKVLEQALYLWDYSTDNIQYIEERFNRHAFLVRPGYVDSISQPLLLKELEKGIHSYSDEKKDIDVLFLGWIDISEHRKEVQRQLNRDGIRTNFSCGHNLAQMQDLIRRSKICLNIHYDSVFILQVVRLNILLSNLACVVSEEVADQDAQELYQDAVVFTPYDQLVDRCRSLLADFPQRKEIAHRSFDWYRNERKWEEIVDFPSLLPKIE